MARFGDYQFVRKAKIKEISQIIYEWNFVEHAFFLFILSFAYDNKIFDGTCSCLFF
jgi:hypothetical protein